jgi:uncharacterized protein YndB with AHSA1/START domain
METRPFTLERSYNSPVAKVWKAITDNADMKQWYFDLPAFTPRVGYEFQFEGGADPGNPYLHKCKVVEVIPEKKISYTWRYEGYPGNSSVTFELFEAGKKTTLRFTHEGLETFPRSNPDLARDNFVKGWTYFLDTALKAFLEGNPEK